MAIHPSALRLAADLETSQEPVKVFVIGGGRLSFSNGTHHARLFGVAASCTIDEDQAVQAWIRAVRRKAGAA